MSWSNSGPPATELTASGQRVPTGRPTITARDRPHRPRLQCRLANPWGISSTRRPWVGLYVQPGSGPTLEAAVGVGVRLERRAGFGTGSPVTQLAEAVEPCSVCRPHVHRLSGGDGQGEWSGGGLVGAQGAVDDVGEPALEAAQRLAAGLAFGAFALVVGPALGVSPDLGDRDREIGRASCRERV